MKKRLNKKTTTKLRRAIATQSIRVGGQDPTSDLPPWQVAMLRRMMGTNPAEPVRCGPKPIAIKASRAPKQVGDPVPESEPEAVTMDAMSLQLLRLREEIAAARNGEAQVEIGLRDDRAVPAKLQT